MDLVRLGWTFDGVLQKRTVASIDVKNGDLVVGDELQQLVGSQQAADPQVAAPAPSADTAWKIDALKIAGIQVRLDKGTAGIVNGNFELNTELTAITLSQAASNLASEEQVIELADIEIPSRLDPFIEVLTVRSIFLRFSLAGLVRKELESVAILSPTIYVSEDLFSYMDDAKSASQGPDDPSAKKQPGWTVKDARVDFGRLVIGGGGRTQYGIPLGFHTRLENVALDNLAALKIDGALRIPERSYTFESYQLEFVTQRKDGKGGELRFSYPPEKNESNLVGTVFLDDIRWRQYRAGDAWLSITFDHEGINGEFGMRAYRGYVSGGFSFFFESETPWVGWIAGKGVDMQRFTDIVSPQNFRMTGPWISSSRQTRWANASTASRAISRSARRARWKSASSTTCSRASPTRGIISSKAAPASRSRRSAIIPTTRAAAISGSSTNRNFQDAPRWPDRKTKLRHRPPRRRHRRGPLETKRRG